MNLAEFEEMKNDFQKPCPYCGSKVGAFKRPNSQVIGIFCLDENSTCHDSNLFTCINANGDVEKALMQFDMRW